jgi:hypothetical protein
MGRDPLPGTTKSRPGNLALIFPLKRSMALYLIILMSKNIFPCTGMIWHFSLVCQMIPGVLLKIIGRLV